MGKIDLVHDLLVKINNIFSDDIIIYKNRIVVGGYNSYNKAKGRYVCVLNENIKQEYDALLGVDAITEIKSIRDAKKDLSGSIIPKTTVEERNDVLLDTVDDMKILDEASEIEEWKPITDIFSVDDIDTLFNKAETIKLFEDSDKYPTFIVGKSLFPLIKDKTVSDLFYSDPTKIGDDNIWKIYFKIIHPYFVAYLCYWILDV